MTTIKFEQYKSLSGVNLGGFFQYHLQKNKIYLIGATGFEPATSRDAIKLKTIDFQGFQKGEN